MATSTRSSRYSVLVADDDDQLRRLLVRVLSKAGFEVVACADGEEALEILKTATVDVVITDLEMPFVDGFSVLEWAQQHRPQIPFIVISGMLTESVRERCEGLGAAVCLAKPLSVASLVSGVTSLATRAPQARCASTR